MFLPTFDVNAFLNAELSDYVLILTQQALELVQFGLVKTWYSLPMHQGMLWIERSTEHVGRSQR